MNFEILLISCISSIITGIIANKLSRRYFKRELKKIKTRINLTKSK